MLTSRTAPTLPAAARRGALRRGAACVRGRGDVAAVGVLIAVILAAVGFRFAYDTWLGQFDILGYFVPNFAYVGERLRSLQVPAWNPYFSSGTPSAGDASAGWMYLPVMVAFALFPAAGTAMKVMVLLQALIGGLATYLLGRRLGLAPLAALFAATALAVGPALYDATGQSTVIGQIATWVPVGLLGAESVAHAMRWSARLAWAGLAGVALVQMFAAWPQGFVYGALLVAGWFAYRAFFAPLPRYGSRARQCGRLATAGAAAAAIAATFGAAAILPRLDFIGQSTIAGDNYSHVLGGNYVRSTFRVVEIVGVYLQSSLFWRIIELNSVVLLLGLLAVLLVPGRYGVRFFVVASLVAIDLAATESVTRGAFYLLPMFERMHSHRPTATMYMVYVPFAMLAGAGVQAVLERPRPRPAWLRWLLPLPVLLLAIRWVEGAGHPVSRWQVVLAVAAAVLVVLVGISLPAAWPRVPGWVPQLVAVGLLALSLVYPTGSDVVWSLRHPQNAKNNMLSENASLQQAIRTMLATHDPGTAAALLQHLRATEPPFRYAAYFGSGAIRVSNSTAIQLQPQMVAILAGARSARLGLEQISGYNPLHLQDYNDYVEAMNHARQDYHWLDVFAPAFSSQLFDMLNVRYVLVPAELSDPPIAAYGKPIYRDASVVVYENPRAFPRAWIVHDVRSDPGNGLALLADNAVDGHRVAFIPGPVALPPTPPRQLRPTSDPPDRVAVTSLRPEEIALRATAASSGLLVVSEPYANGWQATVDGKAVKVVQTDHALQGVPLAAGTHTVVLRYAPRSLAIGLPITGAATLMLIGIWAWAVVEWRRGGRGAPSSP